MRRHGFYRPAGQGRGNHGGRGRGHCYTFQNTGACDRGDDCRFSHDISGQPTRQRPVRLNETPEQQQAKRSYHAWKRLLSDTPNNPDVMRRLWEGALDILTLGDRDWTQQLPQALDNSDDNDKGGLHIRAILETRPTPASRQIFIKNSRNFLLIMTHHSLLHSLAVETYVDSLYTTFAGANGDRAISFLGRLTKTLEAARSSGNSVSSKDFDTIFHAMVTTLSELMKRRRIVRLNDDLPGLIESLQHTCTLFMRELPPDSMTRITDQLNHIRAMIARVQALVADDSSDTDNDVFNNKIQTSFPRELIIPSDRHDNDKRDITDIVIFPTHGEIMSDAKEFLPYTDPENPHFLSDPVQRHIDTYFRLFRHDIFGEMKDGLAGFMHAVAQDPTVLSNPKSTMPDIRAYHYPNAHINHVFFDTRKGLQIQIDFPQPAQVRRKTAFERQKWWEESRRFEEGTVLSLICVYESTPQHLFLKVSEKTIDPTKKQGLTYHGDMGSITANLVTQDTSNLKMLMQAYQQGATATLIEFPSVLPATFMPVLENLKSMQRENRLPFQKWIVPAKCNEQSRLKKFQEVPPPLYVQAAGFRFSLKTIVQSENSLMFIKPTDSPDDEVLVDKLTKQTTLDRGQCRALIAALTREFAFIQGPPGTGKSYLGLRLMKVLLDLKSVTKLGPILVVCYTNHALDQFLEHLLDTGVEKIVRVGGQSKSGKLANHNLRNIRQTEKKTKYERYLAAMNYKKIEEISKQVHLALALLHTLQKGAGWKILGDHIRELYPKICLQFREVDDDDFEVVGRHPFDIWSENVRITNPQTRARFNSTRPNEIQFIIGKATTNVNALSVDERSVLIAHWIRQAQQEKVGELFELIADVTKTQEVLSNVHEETNRRILQEAEVIGVTTSGLANRVSLLQHVNCKVIICEEAGEVMEPHMLSALLPGVEHCIQIGDYEQLRPSVNNFRDLSLESERGKLHQLDRSQFERLSVGESRRLPVPVAQLNVQRRMRPEISTLIRETIYEKLIDHSTTKDLPDVVGMRENVFWLNHDHFEDQKDMDIHHTKSKSNTWEVNFVHALVRHIVRQGVYKSDEIAVLTPYTGQLQKLRAAMRSSFEIVLSNRDREALEKDGFDVNDQQAKDAAAADPQEPGKRPLEKKSTIDMLRVATVDNFQGEEAKIIIVSLVRSNEMGNVGFLKTTNRINVLLSRAQHGMYLIGNVDTYASVDMWQKVIDMLRASDAVGETLALCCPRHPDTIIEVQQPEEFAKFSPEGGCREACADRLDCGHRCQARCHSAAMHAVFQCEKPCEYLHQPCNHLCQKSTCGEVHGKCMVLLDNVSLPCGHVKNRVACHRTLDLATILCDVQVSKRVPGCEHDVLVRCSQDVTSKHFRCQTACTTPLPCGHTCPGNCSRCSNKDDVGQDVVKHVACTKICGRKSGTCHHNCSRLCHEGVDCGLCPKPCEVRCKHNRCPHKCHEPCAPCVEPCAWSCEHQGSCTLPCSAPCNRLPCNERCTKLLPCGHQCPSICGEDCPIDYCQPCGMKSDEQPDMIMMTQYAELDLDESPIVVLGCGHFFTTETLDGLVGLKDVYELDPQTGHFSALIDAAELAASVPKCPNCRFPIKQFVTQRYNRLINRAVIDEMSKRFIVQGQQELLMLEGRLDKLTGKLDESRETLVAKPGIDIRDLNSNIIQRYNEVSVLTRETQSLKTRMTSQYQPAHALHQATVFAITQNVSLDAAIANMSLESSALTAQRGCDQRVSSGARLLDIKLRCMMLEDKFGITRAFKSKVSAQNIKGMFKGVFEGGPSVKSTVSFLTDCVTLIDDCTRESLPKVAVQTTLCYARVAYFLGCSDLAKDADRGKANGYRNKAKNLLQNADQLCKLSFRGRDNLLVAIQKTLRMLDDERHEEMTKEEIEAIKKAMLSGPGGIATHSGHWYNCENGHPFAIGECGMPMELARCPECGAPIGGQSHQAIEGVTRATTMEN